MDKQNNFKKAPPAPFDRIFIAGASGTWYVTAYNPFMNLYWSKPPYQLTLIYNNGQVIIRGLDFHGEGFSLTNAEGGGGYIPASEQEVQLTEDHDLDVLTEINQNDDLLRIKAQHFLIQKSCPAFKPDSFF